MTTTSSQATCLNQMLFRGTISELLIPGWTLSGRFSTGRTNSLILSSRCVWYLGDFDEATGVRLENWKSCRAVWEAKHYWATAGTGTNPSLGGVFPHHCMHHPRQQWHFEQLVTPLCAWCMKHWRNSVYCVLVLQNYYFLLVWRTLYFCKNICLHTVTAKKQKTKKKTQA